MAQFAELKAQILREESKQGQRRNDLRRRFNKLLLGGSGKRKREDDDADVDEQRKRRWRISMFDGEARQCPKCGYGPIQNAACDHLDTHQGDVHSYTNEDGKVCSAKINNSCPRCGYFSANWNDFDPWDGKADWDPDMALKAGKIYHIHDHKNPIGENVMNIQKRFKSIFDSSSSDEAVSSQNTFYDDCVTDQPVETPIVLLLKTGLGLYKVASQRIFDLKLLRAHEKMPQQTFQCVVSNETITFDHFIILTDKHLDKLKYIKKNSEQKCVSQDDCMKYYSITYDWRKNRINIKDTILKPSGVYFKRDLHNPLSKRLKDLTNLSRVGNTKIVDLGKIPVILLRRQRDHNGSLMSLSTAVLASPQIFDLEFLRSYQENVLYDGFMILSHEDVLKIASLKHQGALRNNPSSPLYKLGFLQNLKVPMEGEIYGKNDVFIDLKNGEHEDDRGSSRVEIMWSLKDMLYNFAGGDTNKIPIVLLRKIGPSDFRIVSNKIYISELENHRMKFPVKTGFDHFVILSKENTKQLRKDFRNRLQTMMRLFSKRVQAAKADGVTDPEKLTPSALGQPDLLLYIEALEGSGTGASDLTSIIHLHEYKFWGTKSSSELQEMRISNNGIQKISIV